jgi:hypothetical protein
LKKLRLALASALAVAALADNVTTIIAVGKGAAELNPIVALFLKDTLVYAIFTAFKVFLCFFVAYKTFSPSKTWLLLYSAVLAVFARATIINALNALS